MSKSYIWSALIAFAIIGWFGSGPHRTCCKPGCTSGAQTAEQAVAEAKPFRVGVETFTAVERPSVFPVRGLTEASRQVEVRARTSGIVMEQAFQSGDV
jgi:multidrug efflux pump subunit AcrA (membrane-fusion protein)